jgi:hypothetical protein
MRQENPRNRLQWSKQLVILAQWHGCRCINTDCSDSDRASSSHNDSCRRTNTDWSDSDSVILAQGRPQIHKYRLQWLRQCHPRTVAQLQVHKYRLQWFRASSLHSDTAAYAKVLTAVIQSVILEQGHGCRFTSTNCRDSERHPCTVTQLQVHKYRLLWFR